VTRYQENTDHLKRIVLPSTLQSVIWTKRCAPANETVGLEIFTHFVGNGSKIEIEISDHNGKSFGKYKENISGNRFWTQIKVPAQASQALYAEVKLPNHGLHMKSNPLIILPLVEIKNAKWDKKEARRGDILKLTADVKGAPDGTEGEIEIWEYDADGAHDFVTKFPVLVKDKKVEAEWEYEYHEDTDEIPTAEESEKGYNPPEYFFRVKIGEVSADSGLLKFKDWIKIALRDDQGNPLANEEYKIIFADGSEKTGRASSDGCIDIKDIPPGKVSFELANIPLLQFDEKK
jgi:hypothetical protein